MVWGFAAVFAFLVVGTSAAVILPRFKAGEGFADLGKRMVSWWVIIGLVAGGLIGGWPATPRPCSR